ncbi:hypothetical protein [Tardiphaga robiniae]|uniref:hypothetical protein n=1 Tax=Tardiphaga TaxID=1395974 RepID=UPI00285C3494|nr:hypothetical protein [Tardiphaga robiniae]MDR6661130.1 hypothetical protein [Tardiphaga robiniae]
MAEKLKVKFLTAIWGARYIEEFASISLPSYLADGNLRYVASRCDLEVLILTSTDSRDKFEGLPAYEKLKQQCSVRFIFIDDLITVGNYGVTLTLAYARGIADSGDEQTSTNFVFMNSDFVLADGSLKTLVHKLEKGDRCVMAASLRARAEATVPVLAELVDRENHVLTMQPRSMVQLTFNNLHATVLAKTITQDFVTCETHNQIYWQVDKTTMLGRYHLIFMLAIKPEVPIGPIDSYCDYGFVPSLCPSGKFSIIDDSDDFFMLELQPSAQEKNFLRCGTSTPREIASELSIWTTREHRRFAEIDVVFRSGELPASLAEVRAKAASQIGEIQRLMRNEPTNHAEHFYWASGVQAWGTIKFAGESPVYPPELARFEDGAKSRWRGVVRSRQQLFAPWRAQLLRSYVLGLGWARRASGTIPNVAIWSHLWTDSRLLLNWIRANVEISRQQNLLLCDERSPLPISLRNFAPFDARIGLQDLLSNFGDQSQDSTVEPGEIFEGLSDGRYDNLLVHISRGELLKLKKVLELSKRYLKPSATILVFIEHRDSEADSSNFSLELAQYADDLLPADWVGSRVACSFAGGRFKRYLRQTERMLFRYLWPSTIWRLPQLLLAVMAWPIVAGLSALNNIRMKNDLSNCPAYCSSALLSLVSIKSASRES